MKQIPLLILSVLFTIAAAGGYVYMLSTIQNAVDTASAAQAESASADAQEKLTQSAATFMNDTASDRAQLDTYVVKDEDFVSAINLIESAATREKLTATIGSVGVQDIGLKYHETAQVQLSVKGSFENITAFASALESLPLASRVTAVSIEQADTGWFATFTVEIVKRKAHS